MRQKGNELLRNREKAMRKWWWTKREVSWEWGRKSGSEELTERKKAMRMRQQANEEMWTDTKKWRSEGEAEKILRWREMTTNPLKPVFKTCLRISTAPVEIICTLFSMLCKCVSFSHAFTVQYTLKYHNQRLFMVYLWFIYGLFMVYLWTYLKERKKAISICLFCNENNRFWYSGLCNLSFVT